MKKWLFLGSMSVFLACLPAPEATPAVESTPQPAGPPALEKAPPAVLVRPPTEGAPAIEKAPPTEGALEGAPPQPPAARKIPHPLTAHGHTRIDDYYWLRERDNPEVLDYLKAENEYTARMMEHTEDLQEKLYQEMKDRIKETDRSVPYQLNGYFYYTRYEEGREYPIYCRKPGSLEAEEEIILDVNQMASGYDYYQVVGLRVSEDTKTVAFGVDTLSRRKYTLHFKDLSSGEILADGIPNTTGRAAWANNNRTVFYTTKDKALRAYKIFKHVLGTDPATDQEVFHETDETFSTSVYKTKSKRYIVIASYHTLATEYRYLDADHPGGEFLVFQPRERDHEYHLEHYRDHFYIITNWEARNFRLMSTPVTATLRENWEEVIGHREDVLLENLEVFQDYLVALERRNGLKQLRVIDQRDGSEHYLDFGEETYTASLGRNPQFDTPLLRYRYSSLTTPNSTYDYHLASREQTLLKREEVLGDFNPQDYQARRLYAPAPDGRQVPISLVYRVGFQPDGTAPLLLYGYGSYGYSRDPSFSSVRLSLLDRGFVYAIAHIRGGQELGRWWYEEGKMLHKKNTFTDYIACAEHLIVEKYTSRERLFARGGSAGGLLMGAVLNMRPDLFKGMTAAVPFVDVVTTMLDESIPLTTGEYDEWGDPHEQQSYDYILSYSPYDNVAAGPYPALLVTTGLHDSQVQYWEPAKWVARLRVLKTDDNLLLLKTNLEAGHSGASGRYQYLREIAFYYTFILDQMGISD